MLPGVHCMGNKSNMRGDSDDLSMEKCSNEGSGAADESFLPPIDSRWCSDVHDELAFVDHEDDAGHGHKGNQSRRQGDKKLSKSGRFIANKSSMSDSFVLPNIATYSGQDGIRKSRTAGSNWSHGGETTRTRNGMPISKSCPILKNRNGYQWGKDSSEDEDDDDDLGSDFLSMSYNVMTQSERDKASRHDSGKTSRLARLESNPKMKKTTPKSTSTTTNSSSLGDTKLPNIFDRSPRCIKDDNNNGASERRRSRKNPSQRKSKTESKTESETGGGQEMDYELDVSPWRGTKETVQAKQRDHEVEAMAEEGNGGDKADSGKPKAKRKAGGNQRPPITAKNPDSKCREWLQESHH